MGSISKNNLISYYSGGKSMHDISQILNCSVHRVTYWMNKYNIPKRTRSDAIYIKLNPQGEPFSISRNLDKGINFLYGLGLGIYWGEGNKTDKNALRVSNTDPKIIITFRKFLLDICHIHTRKLHYSLVCFNDTDPTIAVDYWSRHLGITSDFFGKIVQIPPQGKGTYHKKSIYGVCTITYSDTRLKKWIINQITNLPG